MASLQQRGKGSFIIQFYDKDGRRRGISLSGTTKKNAQAVMMHMEHLNSAIKSGSMPPDATSAWIKTLGRGMLRKLATVGLVSERKSYGLQELLDEYFAKRKDWSHRTRQKADTTRKYMIDHFGAEKPVADITPADAEDFMRYIANDVSGIDSQSTIFKHVQRARSYIGIAVKKRLLDQNPFDDVKARDIAADLYFVTREEAEKVLRACPNNQWRLIFAFARFGGVRMPSELNGLTWQDVIWDQNKIRIMSPKTKRYHGKDERFIPIFPELRSLLDMGFEQAIDQEQYVITATRKGTVLNAEYIRKRMRYLIVCAGVTPWQKLFQSCRSSRQTELEADYPTHVVCKWLGNSPKVAQKHYLKVTQADFEKASQAASLENEPNENLMPHAMLKLSEIIRNRLKDRGLDPDESPDIQVISEILEAFQNEKIGQAGLEPATKGL